MLLANTRISAMMLRMRTPLRPMNASVWHKSELGIILRKSKERRTSARREHHDCEDDKLVKDCVVNAFCGS